MLIMSLEQLEKIVDKNPDLLEDYVLKHVGLEQLEKWILRKTQLNRKRSLSIARTKSPQYTDKKKMLQELEKYLHNDEPDKINVLIQLASTVAFAVNSNNWNVFIYDNISNEMRRISDNSQTDMNGFAKKEDMTTKTLAEYVYQTKSTVIWNICDCDYRFRDGSPFMPPNTFHVMAIPIIGSDGIMLGVLELYKTKGSDPFADEDEEIVQSYLVWGGIALHYSELFSNLSRQRKLNTFLLTVVKSIFQDMISMDTVIAKIMEYAKKLVNADRTSLFLVDSNDKQLYAHIFEVTENKSCNNQSNDNQTTTTKKEIRFPIGTGIAGNVAKTGLALNIPDAYEDQRFNRSIDQLTGYRTKNLLCMPIFSKNRVIGVVQMVNKLNGNFNKVDEENFCTFATYCGLALDHARLYEKIRKSEQKNKVALEILSYHNMSNDEELERTREQIVKFQAQDVTHPTFSPYDLSNDHKLLTTIRIFETISGIPNLNNDDLYRFTLSVRKNYRRVPYHNWTHGFSVAHSLYAFFLNNEHFEPLERLAFFVSGLCHDLDHRGTTNQFLIHSSAPLAAIYTTSPLEHHHYNQTVNILQQNGHNILKSLSTQEYKKVLTIIKHCILATDLALFFPNKAKLEKILNAGTFDWTNQEHRSLLEAIAMTGADLNSTARPWQEAREQVGALLEENYAQGDIEKQMGRKPIPMMDRDKAHEQPASQVNFLSNISIPCFKMLTQLLPNTKPYLNHCLRNVKLWSDEVEKEKKVSQRLNLLSHGGPSITVTDTTGSLKPERARKGLERSKSMMNRSIVK